MAPVGSIIADHICIWLSDVFILRLILKLGNLSELLVLLLTDCKYQMSSISWLMVSEAKTDPTLVKTN